MIEIVPYAPPMAPRLVELWNDAMAGVFPIMPELWEAVTAGDRSFRPDDLLVARSGDQLFGFAMTKRYRGDDPSAARYRAIGYLPLMAVSPAQQRQGLGRRLLAAAETRLREEGAARVVLGGSFQHVLPGVPDRAPGALEFFTRAGYEPGKRYFDVRRRLDDGFVMPEVATLLGRWPGTAIRPFRPEEAPALRHFLETCYAGRWSSDIALYLEQGGDVGRILGLFEAEAPVGFAHLHPPGSPGALRWEALVPGVGALGPIGLAPSQQGRGLGLALLVRGVETVRAWGASEMVIDWTDLLDFYGKAGFRPWLAYTLMGRTLA